MSISKDTWIISDTHINHRNILKFTDHYTGELVRPGFDNIEQMNEYIVEQWNAHVKPGDHVIHLGDVTLGPKAEFLPLWKRLNGSKSLIAGNHDDIKFFAKNELVKKIYIWKVLHDFKMVLSHIPLHKSQLLRGPAGHEHDSDYLENYLLNVHGHIHQQQSPPGPYRCVCVEHTDYKPVHIEDLAATQNSQ